MDNDREISWEAEEFDFFNKGPAWYLGTIAIAILIAIFSIWQKNFLFTFFVIVAEILIISFSKKELLKAKIKINKEGVGIGKNKFYHYNTLESFAIKETTEDFNEVSIKKKGAFGQIIKIKMPKEKTAAIKKELLNFLPEVEFEESLIDALFK